VQPGEDITTIAERYGLTVEQLRQWNNLPPGQFLRVGQRLRLTAPATQTPPQDQPPPEPTPTQEEKITVPATKVSDRARAAGPVTAEQPREKEKNPLSQIFRGDPPQTTFVYIRPVKDEIDRPRIKRGRWRYVVIHHSETPSGNAAIFDRFHRNVRKWENGLAYHFVIGNGRGSGDGQIEVGQRWKDQLHGGHLRSAALNDISIGICLVGSYNVERPTARQIAATIELVQYLRRLCGNPRLEFTIHRRINPTPTDCPGKLFPERTMFLRLR
jgi:murein DD-endopeptidase MepM/ murein hydrolase activator NlpD